MPTTERMEVTEYLDGNGEHELTLQHPLVQLRGVWVDENRGYAHRCLVAVQRFDASTSLQLASDTAWPVGSRNVKVVYCADVPVDTEVCERCEDEGTVTCGSCNGSGEGMHDGTKCRTCKGEGELPCECQADRLRDEEDAREASREDAYEARRDGD